MGAYWVSDIERMHARYFVDKPARVAAMSPEDREGYYRFRLAFMAEEMEELRTAPHPADAVDALIDVCVVAIGTLHAFGVDARLAWDRVLEANMKKSAGRNPKRPSKFGFDLVKPEGWTAPDHSDNVGCVPALSQEVGK